VIGIAYLVRVWEIWKSTVVPNQETGILKLDVGLFSITSLHRKHV